VNDPVVVAGLGLCVVCRGNRRTGGFVCGRNSRAVALNAVGVEKGLKGGPVGRGRAAAAAAAAAATWGLTYLFERRVKL